MNVSWESGQVWTADCLDVMSQMESNSFDLIYLDPPFNSKADYSAPDRFDIAGSGFSDKWRPEEHRQQIVKFINGASQETKQLISAITDNSDKVYLIYLALRLEQIQRILKPTGTIYLHCDQTMAHYIKIVMDTIFGKAQFRNEIIWCYSTGGATPTRFSRKHDNILCYGNGHPATFNTPRVPYTSNASKNQLEQDKFHPDGKIMLDWWTDIQALNPTTNERTGYPTQKPLKLLYRIIEASSNEGDVFLDPFAGSGTSCVAAHKLNRVWAGIDISPETPKLIKKRIETDMYEQKSS